MLPRFPFFGNLLDFLDNIGLNFLFIQTWELCGTAGDDHDRLEKDAEGCNMDVHQHRKHMGHWDQDVGKNQ